ncbi:hypothetical protein F53441_4446 [Fusarium austroafricanum]|uniref:Malate dehydrogenase n=1 Tax=Fusarium austroafricanum TaxID=2364996 RepID=A0A8H4KMB1_9HYPO|nr:hypothetical protein F53441_4446 [Fusarium austroafricanum]
MLAKSFLVLASATMALASPIMSGGPLGPGAPGPLNHGPGSSCKPGKPAPVLPVNGGPSELPAPSAGATLKHIALGFGIQNYTCADAAATPAAVGALAVLYDVTHLYPGQSRSSLTQEKWASLTADVLNTGKVPLNLKENGVGASLTNPFPKSQDLQVQGLRQKLPYIGHHFFNAAGVPTFDLDKVSQLLLCKKIDGIKAPASAPAGPDGTGAVDWLYLGDSGGSIGVNSVYRVLTAGGASHGCKAKGTDSTSYTTLYWFYG